MLISLLPAKKGLWTFVFTRKSKEEEYRFQKIRMHSSSVHEGNSFFPRIQGNVKLFLWLWKYLKHKTLWNI